MELKSSNEVCALLRKEIRACEHTYKYIASRANLTAVTVSNIATGTTRFPRFETIIALLKFFGYTISVARRPHTYQVVVAGSPTISQTHVWS